jgi:GST-like protein
MSIYPSRWPVEHPDRIQLYALNTPNGVKASIVLEELDLPYELHRVDFAKREQHDPGYLLINPNNKIPSIIDPDGPGGKPLAVMESGAILHYLAKKTGRLLPEDPATQNEALQWLFFQTGSVGPMFGQYGHFVTYAPKDQDHAYAIERYTNECKRLLGVMETRLDGREWFVEGFSIVDIMIAPWIGTLPYYGGPVADALPDHPRVVDFLERFNARPAVQRGVAVVR